MTEFGIYESDEHGSPSNRIFLGDYNSPECIALLNERRGETLWFAWARVDGSRNMIPFETPVGMTVRSLWDPRL